MKLSRRDFIHAGCAVTATTLISSTVDRAEAGLHLHGSTPQFSQRSVINLGFIFDNSYPFINFYLAGDNNTSPVGSTFTTGTPWPALIDANGWPNQPGVSGTPFGGSARIPGSDEYTGKWVLVWDGDGQVDIGLTGTWTVDAASSSNYVQNGNGRYANVTFGVGSSPRVVVTLTGATGPQLIHVSFTLTDPNSVGAYLKNFRFYQLGDETDLLAGKIFRVGFKQPLVNLNPSAIRFLNWHGGSATRSNRFENRTLPSAAGYSYQSNWVASPSYPAATGTNIFSVGVAVPTTANPKNTPASLTHGEIAVLRFTSGSIRNGVYTISAIANGPNAQVTTSAAHGLNSGDTAIHFNSNGMGMPKLNYFPVVVTVVDATHYTIGIDTTTYGTFTSAQGTQYWSINIGARGAKPISWPTGSQPASLFGTAAGTGGNDIPAGAYTTLAYDKNFAIQSDGAGNMIFGAWVFQGSGAAWGDSAPLEIMTALINEVNALSVSQGITTSINMWLNMPHTGLTSMDSDYTTASDYALNAVDVITNPTSVQRAGGYSALTANAKLFIEYSNETWNSAGGFWAFYYLARMGFLRWPTSGATNAVDMYILRSTIVMRAITAQFGTSRIKRVLSGAGFFGYSVGSLNEARVNASATPGNAGNFYLTDALAAGFGTPITNHDCFATATYFDGDSAYAGGTGTGSFTDDSALYAGTAPYGAPNQALALSNFVAKIKANSNQPVDGYLNNSLSGLTATYAAAMAALGKTAINYEGGFDWQVGVGQSLEGVHTITAADSTFLIAALDSTQWRDVQINYFNRTSQLAGSAMPSVYTYIGSATDQRWAYCKPDSFVGTTEGQALLNSPIWVGMGARNQGYSS